MFILECIALTQLIVINIYSNNQLLQIHLIQINTSGTNRAEMYKRQFCKEKRLLW